VENPEHGSNYEEELSDALGRRPFVALRRPHA
jgi:hypothetical protein